MILYFSGTGNSKFVAAALADILDDELVSLNQILKENKKKQFYSHKPFVVVTPVYAWRIPIVVTELLENAIFTGNKKLYFLATMGGQSANCAQYCKKICSKNKMQFMGFGSILMPNNYVALSPMPDKTTIKNLINNALPLISSYASSIKKEALITKSKNDTTYIPSFLSGPVNILFRKFMVSSKKFIVSKDCISCGKCAQVCSLNNINMSSGKPEFKNNCINCYACIHNCPKAAINIKGKTETHGRYLCPDYERNM